MGKEKDILHTHVFYNVTQHFPVLLKCFAGECDPLKFPDLWVLAEVIAGE